MNIVVGYYFMGNIVFRDSKKKKNLFEFRSLIPNARFTAAGFTAVNNNH